MQSLLRHAGSSMRSAVLSHAKIPVGAAASLQAIRSFGADTLSKDEVTERVLSVVKVFDKVDPAKVTPTATFSGDLGLDSLDTVEVVMSFEEEFGIEVPDAEADKITSCADAINYISHHPLAK
uniref:Acyl carrier protein n=1 Tax=Pyramimonas obovata TaxID=1411642 RepID=A0A7S0RFU8_9CHLO|mmetsp:Transcript_33298/g.72650  ORF Transcript_33298/g.72650 Transcript_33298/m.72650 type:complete len:123 (+) Transcript_33298:75-443(+)|eukprot:CAMPEP_0118935028 /NCGR_PEP_ID=MMETSP1169-20130426/14751_1 /TAXON_ID=36882 /ORGANISM="Pyramimonas obovata, Strain CCMP722" /LENGTH=122 /DNA_ID=CAMNT_0006878011 /DNA_START=67 /DNA_END=435 /DNA_ORIENTATION=+